MYNLKFDVRHRFNSLGCHPSESWYLEKSNKPSWSIFLDSCLRRNDINLSEETSTLTGMTPSLELTCYIEFRDI